MTNAPVAAAAALPKAAKAAGQDRLVCSLCNKVYRSSAGLRYHKRKRHRGTDRPARSQIILFSSLSLCLCSDEGMLKPTQLHRVRCLEIGCNYQMLAISDLRNHLANHHLKPAYKTTEEKKFNSFAGKNQSKPITPKQAIQISMRGASSSYRIERKYRGKEESDFISGYFVSLIIDESDLNLVVLRFSPSVH